MQSPWEILGIDGDADAREIRRAYAALLKVHRPDTDRERFEQLRWAYDHALNFAGRIGAPAAAPEAFAGAAAADAHDVGAAGNAADPPVATTAYAVDVEVPELRDAATVAAALRAALFQGVLPLRAALADCEELESLVERRRIAEAVLQGLVEDPARTPDSEAFEYLAQAFGWSIAGPEELHLGDSDAARHDHHARLVAARCELERHRARGPFQRRARALMSGWRMSNWIDVALPSGERKYSRYLQGLRDRYGPWVDSLFEPNALRVYGGLADATLRSPQLVVAGARLVVLGTAIALLFRLVSGNPPFRHVLVMVLAATGIAAAAELFRVGANAVRSVAAWAHASGSTRWRRLAVPAARVVAVAAVGTWATLHHADSLDFVAPAVVVLVATSRWLWRARTDLAGFFLWCGVVGMLRDPLVANGGIAATPAIAVTLAAIVSEAVLASIVGGRVRERWIDFAPWVAQVALPVALMFAIGWLQS